MCPIRIKDAACDAIKAGVNRYTQTQGIARPVVRRRHRSGLAKEFPDTLGRGVLTNSGSDTGPTHHLRRLRRRSCSYLA